jgi:hypothetical protein
MGRPEGRIGALGRNHCLSNKGLIRVFWWADLAPLQRSTSIRLPFLTAALSVTGVCLSFAGEAQTPAPAVNSLNVAVVDSGSNLVGVE